MDNKVMIFGGSLFFVVVLIFAGAWWNNNKVVAIRSSCQKACINLNSRLIDDKCFCEQINGDWKFQESREGK